MSRSPTDLDTSFDYRQHLPGVVKVQLAPQLWIWQAEGFSQARAPQVLEGFIELLLGTMADPEHPQVVDLAAVLERIEDALPGIAKPEDSLPMVAIYVLWHAFMNSERHHRPRAAEFIERFDSDLDDPSAIGFAVRLLTEHPIEWTLNQVTELVDRRRDDLRRGRGQPLPPRLDVALLLAAALMRWDNGQRADATALVSEAVEALPGNEGLIAVEKAALEGERPSLNLLGFVVDAPTADAAPPTDEEPEAAGAGGTETTTTTNEN